MSTHAPGVRQFVLAITWLAIVFAPVERACGQGVRFLVQAAEERQPDPVSGRLVVFVVAKGHGGEAEPADGPFPDDPQPMYGIDVRDLKPGVDVVVDDKATSFPSAPGRLPPGDYVAQARLEPARTNSNWRREPGTLYSEPVAFTVNDGAPAEVRLLLDRVITFRPLQRVRYVAMFRMKSEILSKFRGQDTLLQAGVIAPTNLEDGRRYPAVYEVPGFGGDHEPAYGIVRMNANAQARENAFWIVLDPEGPNGHNLFADSANNGPVGRALVEELIPALEARYPLIARPDARATRGHSSGGWSSLWLALTYPDIFGACWSSSPDPVDFRRFQRVDIYSSPNFYTQPGPAGAPEELASYTVNGAVRMTIRQENQMEEVLGPLNTSAQQWDSWMAVFGPRDGEGHPAALYDPQTGVIDHAIAEQFRPYDICDRVRKDPARYLPLFRDRVRLIVGDHDSYDLHMAVGLLKDEVDAGMKQAGMAPGAGYIRIVPGADHGSIFGTPAMMEFEKELADWAANAAAQGRPRS